MKMINPKLSNTPELSYLVGVRFGDGYLFQRNNGRGSYSYRFGLTAKDVEFVKKTRRCLEKILCNKLTIGQQKASGKKYPRVIVTSKKLHSFLNRPLEDFKSLIDKYPSNFLQGLIDSEGSITGAGSRQISIANTNLNLLRHAKFLLETKFDINTYLSNGFLGLKSTKLCYKLQFRGKRNFERFIEKIGFTIERKQQKLVGILNGYFSKREKHEKANELYKQGISTRVIGRVLNIPKSTVWTWVCGNRTPRFFWKG